MTSNLDEKGIHDGHRARMRDKLINHGQRIFDTYELLEMLLYHVIPYRDTNPVAKRLLAKFGSLEGVFSATREELLTVNGIGERAADLILTAGAMLHEGEISALTHEDEVFDNYDRTGEHILSYFNSHEGLTVSAMLLDGGMRLVGRVNFFDVDFGSAAIRSKRFIDEALRLGAMVVILAHKRPHSALFPMQSDRATSHLLATDLSAVGIRIVEHYVISETEYVGITEKYALRLANDMPELLRFLNSREEARK